MEVKDQIDRSTEAPPPNLNGEEASRSRLLNPEHVRSVGGHMGVFFKISAGAL